MNEAIKALREALALSPENAPLRRHFADTLLQACLFEEAAEEYKKLLASAPADRHAKAGLAKASHALGRNGVALVLMEDALKDGEEPELLLLYAKLLVSAGQLADAAKAYHSATAKCPSLADSELEKAFKVDTQKPSPTSQAKPPEQSKTSNQAIGMSHDGEWINGPGEEPKDEARLHGSLIENAGLSFSDVGGMEALKEEIRIKIITPLANPALFQAYGKKAGGGILLYGPPGCGKTHLARATAGEAKAAFLSIGLHDVLDMYIGQSEQRLHEIFESARRMAPCILFFDEVDALGASRSDMKKSAGRHLINQFLAELDGLNGSNDGVLILAATNTPWHLDPAFRRPGRFDRVLFVPPPDDEAKEAILKILLQGKPQEGIDCAKLAKRLSKFTGADLKATVDIAVEGKLREAVKSNIVSPLRTEDLLAASKSVSPSAEEWFATARNYALYSNESGRYDQILEYLGIKKR